jgi:uncharacterized RDD family membrane protein YckC
MSPNSDQLSIDTPELVAIELPLAFIGSRFVALLIDYLILLALYGTLWLFLRLFLPGIREFSRTSEQWASAIAILASFLLMWGYFTLFEAFCGGRTPGKRVAGIRVIQRSGRAIGLFESMARNFIRCIDMQPLFLNAVGVIAMFISDRHQRLGDLAAGTLVVHDRDHGAPLWSGSAARTFTAPSFASGASAPQRHLAHPVDCAPGIARLSPADLGVLEEFFSRRLDMSLPTRDAIAQKIAAAIRAKSGLAPSPGVSNETFLETTACQLRDTARMRADEFGVKRAQTSL